MPRIAVRSATGIPVLSIVVPVTIADLASAGSTITASNQLRIRCKTGEQIGESCFLFLRICVICVIFGDNLLSGF
jgi:hypothetical protein